MADRDRAIGSVAVLGGGIVALSAALAFRQALPGVTVTVIESPLDPAALADRLTTAWPSIARFHDEIGLAERDLVAAGAATPCLGFELVDAERSRRSAFLVHGQYGVPVGSVPFHHLWARAWREGEAGPYPAYATAAVLGAAGQFVHPENDPSSPLSTYDYGLRIDPPRYRAALAARADAMRITKLSGTFGDVTRYPDGRVATIALTDGRSVAADLFIDCAGPRAPLLSAVGVPLKRWAVDLPDTMLLARGAAAPLRSCDTLDLTPAGWRWTVRLADREAFGIAFHAAQERSAMSFVDGDKRERISLEPGWRDPWCRNVLALGDAAIAAAPVPGFHLHLAHVAIARALDLLPGRDFPESETGEYRRRAVAQAKRLGDFLALFQSNVPTDGLVDTIEQFLRRGRYVAHDDDAISSEMWIAALIGRGFVPQAMDAVAAAVSPAQGSALLTDLSRGLATLSGQLPSYSRYLDAWLRQ